MIKRVAAYARVSTAHQGTGLEAQIRSLQEYFKFNGIENVEFFTDENQSGTKASRPALDRMMAAVENGEISSCVCYSFSRFARSVTHLLSALETFKRKDVSFVSLTEKIDTSSPIGKAIFVIISAISQLERDLIAERVRNGLANARAKGIQIGRKKTRPSETIRILLRAKKSYREIAKLVGCSQGAVGSEVKDLRKEEALKKQKQDEALQNQNAAEIPVETKQFPEALKAS